MEKIGTNYCPDCDVVFSSKPQDTEGWASELENSPAYQSLNEMLKSDIKFFIFSLLHQEIERAVKEERERIVEAVRKAEIAEDKVGTFQDGYRCMREQVLYLLTKEK